jgi:hypothetical protein
VVPGLPDIALTGTEVTFVPEFAAFTPAFVTFMTGDAVGLLHALHG